MSNFTPLPRLTQEGVEFTLDVGSTNYECLISRESLVKLSSLKNIDAADADPMDIYHAFEGTIHKMTRMLIAGNVSARPKGSRFHADL